MKRRGVQPIYSNTYRKLRRRYWFLRVGAIGLVLLVFLGGGLFFHYQKQQRLNRFPVHGVALSQEAGFVDFQQLAKQNISFAYLHATTGASYTDDQFQSGYDRAVGTNLAIGVYHVFSFSTSVNAQFKNFKNAVQQRFGNLPIALHVSLYDGYTEKQLRQSKMGLRVAAFIRQVKAYYGRPIVVWCSPKVWQVIKSPALSQNDRWLIAGNLSRASSNDRFIEYNPNGTVKLNGQNQPVSLSVFNGTKDQWRAFLQSK